MEVSMFYDRQGNPTDDPQVWARSFEGDDRRVGDDTVGLYWVSTVFIGINMSLRRGRPLIFETMVFLAGTAQETYMMRYATEDEAQAGHEAVVAEIRVLDEQAAMRERINDQ